MSKPCCPHPVERHAYNGCANCRCGVRWDEHPDRDLDTSPEGRSALEDRKRPASHLRSDDHDDGPIVRWVHRAAAAREVEERRRDLEYIKWLDDRADAARY